MRFNVILKSGKSVFSFNSVGNNEEDVRKSLQNRVSKIRGLLGDVVDAIVSANDSETGDEISDGTFSATDTFSFIRVNRFAV